MTSISVRELARELNNMPLGQSLVVPLDSDFEWDFLTYGTGIDGFKRHLLQNLLGSAYGAFSVQTKFLGDASAARLLFIRHPPQGRIIYRPGHSTPDQEAQFRALGWPVP